MMKKILTYLQYLIPQHALTRIMGKLARCRLPWIKNPLIHTFIRLYGVDMKIAAIENPEEFIDFNHFFIRQLKPEIRPITAGTHEIASPVDGFITEIGSIQKQQLLQAKGHYFSLAGLLGNEESLASLFTNGCFATLYLAPQDYHRIHMPMAGKLIESLFIPGKLFSVNASTASVIPELYSRNERLVTIFDTEAGPMAVILVGAMIVGSIQTVWMKEPVRASHKQALPVPPDYFLKKGDELGHFQMGSTVILLFRQNSVQWAVGEQNVKYGQLIANLS